LIPQATAHYQKRLSDLRGLFLDPAALELRIRAEGDRAHLLFVKNFAGLPFFFMEERAACCGR
jgi:hypothetical protein